MCVHRGVNNYCRCRPSTTLGRGVCVERRGIYPQGWMRESCSKCFQTTMQKCSSQGCTSESSLTSGKPSTCSYSDESRNVPNMSSTVVSHTKAARACLGSSVANEDRISYPHVIPWQRRTLYSGGSNNVQFCFSSSSSFKPLLVVFCSIIISFSGYLPCCCCCRLLLSSPPKTLLSFPTSSTPSYFLDIS